MACDVRERLGGDPQHRHLGRSGQRRDLRREDRIHEQTRAAEPSALLTQRLAEPQLVQGRGPQTAGCPAYLRQSKGEALLDPAHLGEIATRALA